MKLDVPRVGGFGDAAGAADSRLGVPRGVSVSGFSTVSPGVTTSPTTSAAVVDAGFGAVSSQVPGQPRRATVQESGFSAQAAPLPASDTRAAQRIDTPVEVLSKPTPDYTPEARALKLEGEVILEVEFLAANQVRVVRIVRGLGHGLDEAAVQAAERLRFKPARSGGRLVDFRTTVHVVFRLT
jgi:TonB family protein